MTTLNTGSGPRTTVAKSRIRIGWPSAVVTTKSSISGIECTRPSTTVRYRVWFSSCIPADATRLLASSAVITSWRLRPVAPSRRGSTTTWYSGARPPTRSTRATPGILRKRSLRLYRAVSHSSVMLRVSLVKLTPRIGNAANVSRYTVVSAVAGRVLRICDRRLNT